MWRLDGDGSAGWQDGDQQWSLQIAGGLNGIRLAKRDPASNRSSVRADSGGNGSPLFSIGPAGSDRFPDLAEAFVRGDELHLDYPQGDGAYSVAVVCRVVESQVVESETTESRAGRLVTEWTIAIQTSRLESHPMLDLWAGGNPVRRFTAAEDPPAAGEVPSATAYPEQAAYPEQVEKTGVGGDRVPRRAAPITAVRGDGASVAVLLAPGDFPWTLDLSDDHGLRQRLFGDFLEKGVIRKARPWVVVEETPNPVSENWGGGEASDLIRRWQQLCRTPLPLTA